MMKVNEALKIILKSIKALPSEEVRLTEALGRIVSQDIHANIDIPQFNNSAMDGYAVRAEDTIGASQVSPRIFEVIEDLRAGYVSSLKIKKNQAIRIMTGAPIPGGADSVIMVEDTEKIDRDSVKIFKEVEPGENVRERGEDIKRGELIISKGTFLASAHIGILASLGKKRIKVTRKPKVAILATGDEVIDIDKKLRPGKLYSSNTYTLYSQVVRCGGIPENLGVAGDDTGELKKKIREGLDSDLFLSSGGVSVGDYDLVKSALAKMGTMKFWKVAMRPGKPLVFGMINNIPLFGLPGNPVSSMVSFEIFVKPVISRMLGRKISNNEIEAILEEDIKKKKGLRYFLRAKTCWKKGGYFTSTTGPQGSGILKSMALANSLIILPEEKEFIKKGEKVLVKFLH